MALFSANHLRVVESRPAPRQETVTLNADLLKALAAEATPPAFSRVVFLGVVRGVELALLVPSGLGLYFFHVTPRIGPQPVYFALTLFVSVVAILFFQTLQSYTVPNLRRPLRHLFRMFGGWTA